MSKIINTITAIAIIFGLGASFGFIINYPSSIHSEPIIWILIFSFILVVWRLKIKNLL